MPAWRLRDFHDDDLDDVIAVWDSSRLPDEPAPVFGMAEVMSAARAGQPAVVAVVGESVVGVAVARADNERAWILVVALAAGWRSQGIGSELLAELERRLRGLGVRRISALSPAAATGSVAMRHSGFRLREGLCYYEKIDHLGGADTGLLKALGGRMLPRHLWNAMAGMEAEKRVIERRIVLPLARPDLADEYGVQPPKAVILFGPPGTGKTSFAKAVASRLDWPFVELFPSRLASDRDGLAASLREVFADLAELDEVLLFIDEFEEIAGSRSGQATDAGHGVTNELLKIIPGFREGADRLLICATNSIRCLDGAFLRPGRFDYILPVGPPDPAARAAIWRRYLGRTLDGVDVDALVAASEMFTPADIEFAARKGSQVAFEREITNERGEPATTGDYLTAIAETRPTLTAQSRDEFTDDIDAYTRM